MTVMDLIPDYTPGSYVDVESNPGYPGFSASTSADSDTAGNSDNRQRTQSGDRDRVVILPRRLSETESMSAEYNGHHGAGHLGEWRVPPGPGHQYHDAYSGE